MRCAGCLTSLGADIGEPPPGHLHGLPACEGCAEAEDGPELRVSSAHVVTPGVELEGRRGDPGPCEAHGVGGSCGTCLLEEAVELVRIALRARSVESP